MAIKHAANNPAPWLQISFVKKYMDIAVKPLQNSEVEIGFQYKHTVISK